MANAQQPFGFIPVLSEGKQNRIREYAKTSGEAIYAQDAVKLTAAGTVSVAGSGQRILGVAAAYAAADAETVKVYDDPEAVFKAQADGSLNDAADIGLNINLDPGSPYTPLQVSGQALLTASKGTEATKQFKLIGSDPSPLSMASEAYATWYVKPNEHEFKAGVSGV